MGGATAYRHLKCHMRDLGYFCACVCMYVLVGVYMYVCVKEVHV